METNTQTTTPAQAAKTPRKAPKKVTKKAGAKKTTAKVVSKPASEGIALKTICGQLKIEPRAARRKLRNAELDFHDHRDRWTFTPKQAERVKELLRA